MELVTTTTTYTGEDSIGCTTKTAHFSSVWELCNAIQEKCAELFQAGYVYSNITSEHELMLQNDDYIIVKLSLGTFE